MMKKIFLLGVAFLFFLTGCSSRLDSNSSIGPNQNEMIPSSLDDDTLRTMTCTGQATVSDGVESEIFYHLTYRGLYVEQIHTEERFHSDNTAYLSAYRQYVEEGYQPYRDLDYYHYDVTLDKTELRISVDIDYTRVDTKKMLQIDPENASIIQDGKVLVSTMKTLYESVGAVCE